MLELRNVTKQFGKAAPAVNDISLTLQAGVLGLIGHNGAGKTTLMQMIATLLRPTSGQILFDGTDIVKTPKSIRRRLGYLPQDFGVYPNLTAMEFMLYIAALKGCTDRGRIRHLLELVNLHDHADRQAAAFSGGMRRRLGIAQALLNDPDILIVDEPTAGLDPEERLRFRNLLSELGDQRLVIMSTHIVSDIESIATDLVILNAGRLIVHATPEQIIDRATGQVWGAELDTVRMDALPGEAQILHTQRVGSRTKIRIAHPVPPCDGALLVQPTLEEALMAQRYAQQEPA